jgi:hypothetical protein
LKKFQMVGADGGNRNMMASMKPTSSAMPAIPACRQRAMACGVGWPPG